MPVSTLQLVSMPVVGGLIGWLTNWLAVRMLFRPRGSFKVLGVEFQGLVPRRQAELAQSIGHTVERHLIRHEDIAAALAKAQSAAGLEEMLRARVAKFLDTNLKQIHPMAGMLLTGSIRKKLETMLISEIEAMIPEVGEKLVQGVTEQLDFRKIVEERVMAFDLDQLEKMIMDISHRELRAIEVLGGVLGVAIGLFQAAFAML